MMNNNLLGQLLVGALVFFLLLSSVQMFGWGQGIAPVELNQDDMPELPVMPKAKQITEEYSSEEKKALMGSIYSRPIFSTTREPFKELEKVIESGPGEDEPVSELKSQLTGVVITPEQSYAMILDTATNQRAIYKVGMPLEGEQGGWTLDSIQSRKVVLVSDDDKTEELELEVYSGGLQAGTASKKSLKGTRVAKGRKEPLARHDNKQSKKDQKKNADDIRKKIAERRAQMRADAAKKK